MSDRLSTDVTGALAGASTGADPDALATYAPEIGEPPRFLPTGNLWVSVPETDIADGSLHAVGVLLERALGLVEAGGPLVRPFLSVGGERTAFGPLEWDRVGNWLPHFVGRIPAGVLEGWLCAPVGERGIAFRLAFHSTGPRPTEVELGWEGSWHTTTLTHLRPKPVGTSPWGQDDPWTGSRTVSTDAGLPLLAISWQGGDGVAVVPDGDLPHWEAHRTANVGTGQSLEADLFIGVATEPDGSATTALHLRRRGFARLWGETCDWLDHRALPVPDPRPGLAGRLNANLFFNYFFAQGDCLDTGRPVLVTSRSRQYYVAAAFWSRDAYCWTFPALLLTDPDRARSVLVATLDAAGSRVAEHALYLNGTPLYPGFELDQAAAPIIALWRYLAATRDSSVLAEVPVRELLTLWPSLVEGWRHPSWDLYGTFLLPTDDPTGFPYTTTGNAMVAAAFEAMAALAASAGQDLAPGAAELAPAWRTRAAAIRSAMAERLVVEVEGGRMWAWACDEQGRTECRDEPPLSLRTLPYWGVGDLSDPVQSATRAWLHHHNPHHYEGRFPGAGSAHFPHSSGFDLANRLLDGDPVDGDPLEQLATVPMDQGLACESWDTTSGRVRTGPAMASMAGLLAWTAWEHLSGPAARWDRPTPPTARMQPSGARPRR